MNLLKKFLLLLLVGCSSAFAQNNLLIPGQNYLTGELVNNGTGPSGTTGIWQNIGLWNQGLPCWGPGGPVYCGPNPYFNQGNLNFSYGLADVYQEANVSSALPQSGTGLLVTGYNFSFTAKNGNGWDNGALDYLTAYVRLFDKNGATLENKNYNLNYIFNWTNFNYNETFAKPYSAAMLGMIRYGFVGRDNNGWAGPYGPEVTNISFNLKYSVDPCFINQLSSPSCPGFADALAKLTPAPTTVAAEITTTSPTISVSAPVVETTPTTATTVAISPVSSQPGQTSSNTNEKSSSNPNAMSVALSIVAKNQEREAGFAATAVQNAVSIAESAAEQSQQEASKVAATAVTNSMNMSVVNINREQQNQGQTTNQQNDSSSIFSLVQSNNFEQRSVVSVTTQSSISQSVETYAMLPPNPLTDKTNPLNEIIEGRQQLPQSTNTIQQMNTVNKDAKDNDIAGGVTVARIAVSPAGYDSYLNLALRDASFYEPKEVYKNQRTVDNVRLLRLMNNRSDRLHQDMVDQQYRK